jgi:hypothetical protein
VVGTASPASGVAGPTCRAHDNSGHEGVPAGHVIGEVHLVDGGDDTAASSELYTPGSLHFASSKEMLRCVETHVASVCLKCFGCFRDMLQLCQMNVAKIDQNVAYVAMVVHVCCKSLLQMFHLCFWMYYCKCVYLYVAYVSHICCKCFI